VTTAIIFSFLGILALAATMGLDVLHRSRTGAFRNRSLPRIN